MKMSTAVLPLLLPAALVMSLSAIAQPSSPPQPNQTTVPLQMLPRAPEVPPISAFTPYVPTTATGTPLVMPARSSPLGLDARRFFGPFHRPQVPPLFSGNGDRLRSLVRDGKLYLTRHDAIALAIENNLDVEIERYNLILADTDRRRAAGGGNLRGIDFTIQEPPNGVGGPGLAAAEHDRHQPQPHYANGDRSHLAELHDAGADQSRGQLHRHGAVRDRPGGAAVRSEPVPGGWISAPLEHRAPLTAPQALVPAARDACGDDQPQPLDFVAANLAYLQGFRTGAQLEATVNNDSQVIYGSAARSADPFSRPSTSVTLTQPLLRGFGSTSTSATSASRTRTARSRGCSLSSRCSRRFTERRASTSTWCHWARTSP